MKDSTKLTSSTRRVRSKAYKKILEEIKENMIEKIKELENVKQAPSPIFDDKTKEEKIIELLNNKKSYNGCVKGQELLRRNRSFYYMQQRAFK